MSVSTSSTPTYDALIVGGSNAGLSAALALGRSLRKTLVIDSGKPCNRQTPHSQNFLTRDGEAPSTIARIAKEQVQAYPTVEFRSGIVVDGSKKNDESGLFQLHTDSGETVEGKKVIFATGLKDVWPDDVPGLKECWAKSAIHCPYCHGYEFRAMRTGLLANDVDNALHLLPLIRNLSDKLTILTHGEELQFSEDALEKFINHGIALVRSRIQEIQHDGHGFMSALKFEDGTELQLDAMYTMAPTEQTCSVPLEKLGCEADDDGFVQVNMFQKTNIEGVFACGDMTTPFRSVANAVASGNVAGAVVNMELAQAEF